MESIVRGVLVYLFVWLILRISGKRTLSEVTAFDFVLLLIISETIQESLIGEDRSMTNGLLLIIALIGTDIVMSLIKQRSNRFEAVVDGQALIVLEKGKLLHDRMNKSRIDEEDILTAARESHGLRSLDEIDYAVLERSGGISIIPKKSADS